MITHRLMPRQRSAGGGQSSSTAHWHCSLSIKTHPVPLMHVSAVHGSVSSHSIGSAEHVPSLEHRPASSVQRSGSTHGSPSSGMWIHPFVPSQLSAVQLLLSSHGMESVTPSQSLSTPSHISSAGVSAVHSDRIAPMQVLSPVQAPSAFSITHGVARPFISSVQAQTFDNARHWFVWHPKPGGQSVSDSHCAPQKEPVFP